MGQCATIAALYITEAAHPSQYGKPDRSTKGLAGQLLITVCREEINGKWIRMSEFLPNISLQTVIMGRR